MLWRTKPPGKRPGLVEPCIPTRALKPPVGPQWIHEIKHDGYRLTARKRDSRVRLFTRNGFDWTDRYPRISEAVAGLRTASAAIDGEAVWCDGEGLAIFDKLHSRAYDAEVILYAFDLLELDGEDWRPRPLEERGVPFDLRDLGQVLEHDTPLHIEQGRKRKQAAVKAARSAKSARKRA
jgi:ATP-dependent DNA ligase